MRLGVGSWCVLVVSQLSSSSLAIRPQCLDTGTTLRNLTIDGVKRPVGLVVAQWSSARFLSEVMLILSREVLGIDAVFSSEPPSSHRCVLQLSGSNASGGLNSTCGDKDVGSLYAAAHDVAMEVWESWAMNTIQALPVAQQPETIGSPGFEARSGIFLPGSSFHSSGDATMLDFYRTYNASGSKANAVAKAFRSYTNVTQYFSSLDSLATCAQDPHMQCSTANAASYRQHSGDKGGSIPGGSYNCSGPAAAVWYSPSCRLNRSSCIPVLSNNGWGLSDAGLDQKYTSYNMPFAVFNVKGAVYNEVVRKLHVLFYTWVPDASYSSLDPVQVLFPPHDPDEWKNGIKVTSPDIVVSKMARKGFKQAAVGQLWSTLSQFSISLEQMRKQMKKWPVARNLTKEHEVACQWVKANKAKWSSWIGKLCAEGEYSPAGGSQTCLPCRAGFYCPQGTLQTHMEQHLHCTEGYSCPPGSAAPQACQSGHYSSASYAQECSQCSSGRSTNGKLYGSTSCTPCAAGSYQEISGQALCNICTAGYFSDIEGGTNCKPCSRQHFTSPEGSTNETACRCLADYVLHEDGNCAPWTEDFLDGNVALIAIGASIVSISILAIMGIAVKWIYRINKRKALEQIFDSAVGVGKLKQLDDAMEGCVRAGVAKKTMDKYRLQMRKLERKYITLTTLLDALEGGDTKLVRGSWLADNEKCPRLKRCQELEPESFWSPDELRALMQHIQFVAISYGWLHPVNPDPKSLLLVILQHALFLRLHLKGPGKVADLAVFFDFLSIAQEGEAGDPTNPIKGEPRTSEEFDSFLRGLGNCNLWYAHQATAVFLVKWVAPDVKYRFDERGWPCFEEAVSAMVKDGTKIVELDSKSNNYEDWITLHEASLAKRSPPVVPEVFRETLATKVFTNGISDCEFVADKYVQTFHEVVGLAQSLWFGGLAWDDDEASQVARILPYCQRLEQLALGSNRFTFKGAEELVNAACLCPTLVGMDLTSNPISVGCTGDEENAMFKLMGLWQDSGKDPTTLRLGRITRNTGSLGTAVPPTWQKATSRAIAAAFLLRHDARTKSGTARVKPESSKHIRPSTISAASSASEQVPRPAAAHEFNNVLPFSNT